MTNLLAPMDERLSYHLRRARFVRIVLVVLGHLPLLTILALRPGESMLPDWVLPLTIVLVVATDIILMIDRILDHILMQLSQPKPPGPHFGHEGFEELMYTSNDGTEMPMWYHAEGGGGLAMFLHGWNSCSHHQLERMKALWASGWSTVALDFRGHGGAPSTRIFSSVQAAIDVHHAIEELRQISLIGEDEPFLIHGHSLGGYVAQRVLKTWRPTHGPLPRVILESPLMDLPLIITHMAPRMRILLPLVMWRIARLTQIVEPASPNWSTDSFGIPHWGSFEGIDLLFIQADIDRTLGPAQVEAAKRAYPWLKVHHIGDLEHSARGLNPSRNSVIMDWLTDHSDSDSR